MEQLFSRWMLKKHISKYILCLKLTWHCCIPGKSDVFCPFLPCKDTRRKYIKTAHERKNFKRLNSRRTSKKRIGTEWKLSQEAFFFLAARWQTADIPSPLQGAYGKMENDGRDFLCFRLKDLTLVRIERMRPKKFSSKLEGNNGLQSRLLSRAWERTGRFQLRGVPDGKHQGFEWPEVQRMRWWSFLERFS